jgi:hypothetical protein
MHGKRHVIDTVKFYFLKKYDLKENKLIKDSLSNITLFHHLILMLPKYYTDDRCEPWKHKIAPKTLIFYEQHLEIWLIISALYTHIFH